MKTFNTNPFDWFNFCAQDCNSNALIQFVIKTDNALNILLLQKALVNCILYDPILGCRFSIEGDTVQWSNVQQDISQLCRETTSNKVSEEINRCLSEKIDAEKESSFKIYLIHGKEGAIDKAHQTIDKANSAIDGTVEHYLIIKLHHALCDASGALQFVRLLASMYSELDNNTDFVAQPRLPRRGTEGLYKHFHVTNKKARFDVSLLPDMQSTWGTPYISNTLSDNGGNPPRKNNSTACTDDSTASTDRLQDFAFQIERFSPQELKKIVEFAKGNESSLNAVVTSAYHRALTKLLKPADPFKEIQFSVNLRPYSEEAPSEANTICNLSNLFNVQLSTQNSFVELIKECKQAIDRIVQSEVILQSVLACELMSTDFKTLQSFYQNDWENVQKTGLCTPMISNIGRLDNTPICFGDIDVSDMYLVSPAFASPSFMLSVSTYRNIMTLCVAYQQRSIDEVFVHSLLKELRQILTNIA